MKRLFVIALGMAASAAMMYAVGATSQTVSKQEPPSLADQVASEEAGKREEAARQLLRQRSQTIQSLLAIVRDPSLRKENPEAVSYAMNLLAKMRAAEAVDTLAHMLEYRHWPPPQIKRSEYRFRPLQIPTVGQYVSSWMRSPAAQALIEIGDPALPAVIRFAVEGQPSDIELGYCVIVIQGIEGKRRGLIYLDEALVNAQRGRNPQQAKRRIGQLMAILEDWPE